MRNSIHYLGRRINPTWQDGQDQRMLESQQLWRRIQATVIFSTAIMVLLTLFLSLSWPRLNILQTLFTASLFWIFILIQLSRKILPSQWLNAFTVLLITGATIIIWLIYPVKYSMGSATQFQVYVLFGLSVPLITGGLLFQGMRADPQQAHDWGILQKIKFSELAVGIIIGASLGLHLLLFKRYVPGISYLFTHTADTLVWSFLYLAGLASAGEELFFRGLCYDVLYWKLNQGSWRTIWRIALLNTLPYLVLIAHSTTTLPAFAILIAYRIFLAVINVGLRRHFNSLWPCLLCNIAFGLFAIMVIR